MARRGRKLIYLTRAQRNLQSAQAFNAGWDKPKRYKSRDAELRENTPKRQARIDATRTPPQALPSVRSKWRGVWGGAETSVWERDAKRKERRRAAAKRARQARKITLGVKRGARGDDPHGNGAP